MISRLSKPAGQRCSLPSARRAAPRRRCRVPRAAAEPPQQQPGAQPRPQPQPQPQPQPRRSVLLRASALPLAPLLVQAAIGSNDATTIVNSVLGAYGLPTLKASAGYKVWDDFSDEWSFEYPRGWVARRNSLRRGVVISDFQTADKVAVEELDPPPDGDLAAAAVAAAVLPGGGRLTQDDVLGLPAKGAVRVAAETVDGQEYLYLEFPSETITRSGYQIRRRNFAAAALRRGKLFVIAASVRGDQYNEAKRELLEHTVRSFRLR
ncbi:photosystem II oxygen evolving complex [Raphidocelis subcapitata]|uniref:Photosystem II oxygen evolving complex n=1 Tax=Raphidocelis subcapitata TaxID=307507 RepID=A0A2V0NNW9_9CHLO|nr:photosystem II oxygen evolving complex [Raphidocelis subcapitata]|eukprot:GBF89284.1 photosystem II oxygen evolving complex [Raphidocelis subcapitata]